MTTEGMSPEEIERLSAALVAFAEAATEALRTISEALVRLQEIVREFAAKVRAWLAPFVEEWRDEMREEYRRLGSPFGPSYEFADRPLEIWLEYGQWSTAN
jgi:sulfite reductase beta subunit-like hemoprotein